jgi:hypothetical protein
MLMFSARGNSPLGGIVIMRTQRVQQVMQRRLGTALKALQGIAMIGFKYFPAIRKHSYAF